MRKLFALLFLSLSAAAQTSVTAGVNLRSPSPKTVVVTYTLPNIVTFKITDNSLAPPAWLQTSWTIVDSVSGKPMTLAQIVGANAWFGFCGATGGSTAIQTIVSNSLGIAPNSVLTNGTQSQSNCLWSPKQLGTGAFTTSFTYQATNAIADGASFVIQSQSATAKGPCCGNLGYSGIKPSIAIKLDLYPNSIPAYTSATGLYFNGAVPYTPEVNLLPKYSLSQ